MLLILVALQLNSVYGLSSSPTIEQLCLHLRLQPSINYRYTQYIFLKTKV